MAQRAAVVELPLVPGALSDDTDLAAKLRVVAMDKTRSAATDGRPSRVGYRSTRRECFPDGREQCIATPPMTAIPLLWRHRNRLHCLGQCCGCIHPLRHHADDGRMSGSIRQALPRNPECRPQTAFDAGEVEITFAVYDCATDTRPSSTTISMWEMWSRSPMLFRLGDIAFDRHFNCHRHSDQHQVHGGLRGGNDDHR